MVDVHGGHGTHKLCGINQPIRCGTELSLVDQLVERGARDAELASSIGFGKIGHGRTSRAC
jgi:hypothetical protein